MPVDLDTINTGETLNGCFIVLLKEKKVAKNGRPFGDLLLGYKGGEIAAKIWDLSDDLFGSFDKESVVEITGKLDEFMGRPQIIVSSMKTMNADDINYEDFLPSSKYSADELKAQLFSIIDSVQDVQIRRLLGNIFVDNASNGVDSNSGSEVLELFLKAPAAKNFHHAYLGGLAEHTIGVARLSDAIADNYPEIVNRSLLLAGALLHDIGKIREFSFLKTIDYSTEGRLIGHHVLGYEMIKQAADNLSCVAKNPLENDLLDLLNETANPIPDETVMQLLHLILSHHGSYENQSPRKPKTIEALLLHLCDDADAKINAFQAIGETAEDGSDWSPYNRILERFIYLKKLDDANDIDK